MRSSLSRFVGRTTAVVVALVLMTSVAAAAPPARDDARNNPDGDGSDESNLDDAIVRTDSDGNAVMVLGTPYVTGASDASASEIAHQFVAQNRELFGLTPRQVSQLVVTSDYRTDATGSRHVRLGQELQGYRVSQRGLRFAIDRDGRIVSVGGPLARGQATGRRQLRPLEAIQAAGEAAGVEVPESLPQRGRRGEQLRFENTFATTSDPNPVTAEPVWHPRDDGKLRLAWETDFEVDAQTWLRSIVDAANGEVLHQENRYVPDSPQGTVFTGQHPEDSPPRQVVPFSGLDGSWVADRVTSGNNVNAYRDLNDDNSVGYQPQTPASGDPDYQHFDYAWTDAWATNADGSDASLDADIDAVITQLFYYTNVMHDWSYDFGFTEVAGNFQDDNFGRGGDAGDPVLAEAQDGWDVGKKNNANFATPSDGNSPRMQMFMWTDPPWEYRDGSMDGDVIAHEYGHGISTRLVAGPDQGFGYGSHLVHASLGEGWSDIISFLVWGDAVVGEYVTGRADTGIRRVAYDDSDHTYSDYNPNAGSGHPNGEVWATMVYDIRAELGITDTAWLVLTGMKNTPDEPDFMDARDGIFAADTIHNGGDNFCRLWRIFADRGLGTDATFDKTATTSPDDDDTVPADCEPTADADGPYTTDEGDPVVLDASASTKGAHGTTGPIVSYEWDLDDDGDFDDATGPTPTFEQVGQDGDYPVAVKVTNEAGLSDVDSSTVTVDNVLPTVTVDPAQVDTIDEGDSVTVTATYSDPGWLDSHTSEIDWDTPAGDTSAPTPVVTDAGDPGPVQGTVEATFTYGDNGVFDIEVAVTDDHGSGTDGFPLTVNNVAPTATIDTSGATDVNGTPTLIGEIDAPVTVDGNATDPGSDDLTLSWLWGDGDVTTTEYLVNPPDPDPFPSPSVQPRDVDDTQSHTYTEACFYDLTFRAVDDDGADDEDNLAVLIAGDADTTRAAGYWQSNYSGRGTQDFSDATLACYLDIVDHTSLVFHEVRDASTKEKAADVLNPPPGSKDMRDQLDRQLLAALLNLANGAIGYDEMVDTDGDGIADTVFADVIADAEATRLDPTATRMELEEQKDILERINTRDE